MIHIKTRFISTRCFHFCFCVLWYCSWCWKTCECGFNLWLLLGFHSISVSTVMFNHFHAAQMCRCAAVSNSFISLTIPHTHTHTFHYFCPFFGRPSMLSCRSLWRNTLSRKEPNRPCIKRCWVTRRTPVCRNTVPNPLGWELKTALFQLFNTMHCLFMRLHVCLLTRGSGFYRQQSAYVCLNLLKG